MIQEADLAIFMAVVTTGGVSSAARRLGKAPSNVTTRIQGLERELGVELFTRSGRRLVLAAPGRTFLRYAESILRLHAEARSALHEDEPVGELVLGAMDSVAATRLPLLLSEYHHRHPRVTVQLVTGTTASLLAKLEAGELEAAVVAGVGDHPDWAKCRVSQEELVLIGPRGHAPVRLPKDVRYHTCFSFSRGCAYRDRLESWLDTGKVTPSRISELNSYHAILGCVAAGMGVALVPRVILNQLSAVEAVSLHPLPRTFGRIPVDLVWRKGSVSGRVRSFAAAVSSAWAQAQAKAG